jgi:hypothetical protein
MKKTVSILISLVAGALAALGILLLYVCSQGEPLPFLVRCMLVACAIIGAAAGFVVWFFSTYADNFNHNPKGGTNA